jgi:Glycoside hydrolase family 2 C-terminal domain 5
MGWTASLLDQGSQWLNEWADDRHNVSRDCEWRETVGKGAKLSIRTDRADILANGEDLAFCTVEVQDAQGRVPPITDEDVIFKVTGRGTWKDFGERATRQTAGFPTSVAQLCNSRDYAGGA